MIVLICESASSASYTESNYFKQLREKLFERGVIISVRVIDANNSKAVPLTKFSRARKDEPIFLVADNEDNKKDIMERYKTKLTEVGFKNVVNTLANCGENVQYVFENFLDSHINSPTYLGQRFHKAQTFALIDHMLSKYHPNAKKLNNAKYLEMIQKACSARENYGAWVVLRKILEDIS